MRKDIDPASYGRVAVSELPGSPVQGEDVILIAKRYMADPEPYKIVTVVAADQAAILRRSLQQPQGLWRRRPISDNVQRKVRAKAGACVQ